MADSTSLVIASAVFDLCENRTLAAYSQNPDQYGPGIESFREAVYALLQTAEAGLTSEATHSPLELTVASEDFFECLFPILSPCRTDLYLYVALLNRSLSMAISQHRIRQFAHRLATQDGKDFDPSLPQLARAFKHPQGSSDKPAREDIS